MEFCWNFGFQISQFFDIISDPYNKKTQKVQKQRVNDGILKIFCI